MTVSAMDDRGTGGRMPQVGWWVGAIVVAMLGPMIVGFLSGHRDHGGPMSPAGMAVLAIMAVGLVGGAVALFRFRHLAMPNSAAKAPSERANHRLIAWTGALGGVIGLAMAIATSQGAGPGERLDILSGAIPGWFAVLIAFLWGVVLSAMTWRWHRVIDEHEREAYRDGAVAGYYVMAIGAPVWWFLWRGGLLPAVDAFWLFMAVMIASGGVWMWRKYA